jgi:hypothetical protein
LPTNTSGEEIIDNIDLLDNPDDFLVVVGGSLARAAEGCIERPTAEYRLRNAIGFPAAIPL